MAQIKSYTDIEQSKLLANILPTESADLKWFFWMKESNASKLPSFGYSKTAAESYKDTEAVYLPCWSLTALLNILPNPKIHLAIGNSWYCECWKNPKDAEKDASTYIGSTGADNPVDACYEMILKLKEK